MWTYLVLLTAAFFFLYKYATRKFDYWKKRNVPYLKPTAFLGNIPDIIATKLPIGQAFAELWKKTGQGDFFGIFLLGRPTLLIANPRIVKAIVQKDFTTFDDRTASDFRWHPVLSNGLFFQRNPVWKGVRSKLSPIFTSGKLKLMFPLMVKECQEMSDYIDKIVNIPDVESKEICAKLSTNVITRCAFAVEANSFKDENAIFRQTGREMFDFRLGTALRQLASMLTPDFVDTFHIDFFNTKIIDTVRVLFSDVLNSRKKLANLKGNDFVDILLEVNRAEGSDFFSEDAMLGQAFQFFGAGFETVSSTMSYTLYELCVNPDIQERLRDEIMESVERNNGITYESLNEMKYLDMVISETLRKYPAASFLDRRCKEDYKVEGTDLVIEKGTAIFIPAFSLHYNPEYFPNPEKFDPERFSDKSKINNDGLFYIPFGEGPRICIGQRFGLLEVKLGVTSILRKYRLERSPKTPVPIKYELKSLVLQSKVGIPLKFVPIS